MRLVEERWIDTILFMLLVFLFIGMVNSYYREILVNSREVALKAELANLRLGLTVYKIQTSSYPDDIRQLLPPSVPKISYKKPSERIFTGYLRKALHDEEGFPVDPFGKRYAYAHGVVSSISEGYENW